MALMQSEEMKIAVFSHQVHQIPSKDNIKKACMKNRALAFDLLHQGHLVGFAALRSFEEKKFFLWCYAIDRAFQRQGLGKPLLQELIVFLKEAYDAKVLTTTYTQGNLRAQRLYESIGFVETDRVDEEGCREVNMMLRL